MGEELVKDGFTSQMSQGQPACQPVCAAGAQALDATARPLPTPGREVARWSRVKAEGRKAEEACY